LSPMERTIVFSTQAFALDSIKKAAYRFSDVMSVDFVPQRDEIKCTLHFIAGRTEEDILRFVAEFKTEVLDQDLRATIAKETAPIRNAVLGYAFSKTGLQDRE
jgi:His-Xaa-Ser system protein HxsD